MFLAKETSIFIGVLTYPDSRYSFPHIESLIANLKKAGLDVQFAICDKNLAQKDEAGITRGLAARAAFRDLVLRMRWYVSLSNHSVRAQGTFNSISTLAKRILTLSSSAGLESAQKSMIRLKNIAMGHASLWSQALASKTDWILILEDDATPIETSTTHEQLVRVLELLASSSLLNNNVYCDLSRSFSSIELGIEITGKPVQVVGDQVLHGVARPFTNTLCAVLMSRSMVQSLSGAVRGYLESPTSEFLPIDWLVNKHLLDSFGKKKHSAHFYNLDPGLFVQESLNSSQ